MYRNLLPFFEEGVLNFGNSRYQFFKALLQVQNKTIDVVDWNMNATMYKNTLPTAPFLLISENPNINSKSVMSAVKAVRAEESKKK